MKKRLRHSWVLIIITFVFLGCHNTVSNKVNRNIITSEDEELYVKLFLESRKNAFLPLAEKVANFFISERKHWMLRRVIGLEEISFVNVSPDTCLMLILSVNEISQPSGRAYSGCQYIGWRENTDSSWRFIFYPEFMPSGISSPNKVRRMQLNYFTSSLHTKNGTYVRKTKDSEVIMELFKYGINHDKFWDGVLWEKNYLVDSMYLYPFQMEANGKDGYDKIEGVLFNDSLLNTLK